MPNSPALTDALRAEYEQLFTTCVIRPARQADADALVKRLAANQARYAAVAASFSIPWHIVAIIHNMEADQNFRCHLHNGDPLTARTVQEPTGRPKTGSPPFTWEDSARDALGQRRISGTTDWSIAGTLYQLEAYNGFGYRNLHPNVLTPYLWSFSNHYTAGKFVGDHEWSGTAVSAQCGAAVLLRRMADQNLINLGAEPAPADEAPPPPVPYATRKSDDPAVVEQATALQNWLNEHAGASLTPDGVAGKNTSDAYRVATGTFLPGDPRAA